MPTDKKVLAINNGAYNNCTVEVCEYYGLSHIDLSSSVYKLPDLNKIEETLKENPNIAMVYTTHHETGTDLLNPIRAIGGLAHEYSSVFVVDTTSLLGMIPLDIEQDNVDFCMSSAQKGLMLMTGLFFY